MQENLSIVQVCCQLLLAVNPLKLSRKVACVLLLKHSLEWDRKASGERESVKNFLMSQSVKVCIGSDTRSVLFHFRLYCVSHDHVTICNTINLLRSHIGHDIILTESKSTRGYYAMHLSELVYLNSTNYSYTNLSTDQSDSLYWSDGTCFALRCYARCK